jgi:hypothetical protein
MTHVHGALGLPFGETYARRPILALCALLSQLISSLSESSQLPVKCKCPPSLLLPTFAAIYHILGSGARRMVLVARPALPSKSSASRSFLPSTSPRPRVTSRSSSLLFPFAIYMIKNRAGRVVEVDHPHTLRPKGTPSLLSTASRRVRA